MKRFMYFSIGALCLSAALAVGIHIGSQNAEAQSAAIVGFIQGGDGHIVINSNGDVWQQNNDLTLDPSSCSNAEFSLYCQPPTYVGNFWFGQPPVANQESSWGTIKDVYKKKD